MAPSIISNNNNNNKNFNSIPFDDEELIKSFLYNKIKGQPLPNNVNAINILECDLYGEKNPWEIWEEFAESNSYGGKDLYFFTILKRKSLTSSRSVRTIGLGSWEGEDVGKHIVAKGTNQRIGLKKRFRFEKSGTNHDGRWIMHEYSIDSSLLTNPPEHNYVLCRFRKNTRNNNAQQETIIINRTTRQQEENQAILQKRVVVLALETTKETANNDVEMGEDIHKRERVHQSVNNGDKMKIIEEDETTIAYDEKEQEDGNCGSSIWSKDFAKQLREINHNGHLIKEEEEIILIPNLTMPWVTEINNFIGWD